MYRWQTMTLARAEQVIKPASAFFPTLNAIKHLLYQIGHQHFPEPDVSVYKAEQGPDAVALFWSTEDRELQVLVWMGADPPSYSYVRRDGKSASSGIIGEQSGDRGHATAKELVAWFLFGGELPDVPETTDMVVRDPVLGAPV